MISHAATAAAAAAAGAKRISKTDLMGQEYENLFMLRVLRSSRKQLLCLLIEQLLSKALVVFSWIFNFSIVKHFCLMQNRTLIIKGLLVMRRVV